MPFAGLLRRPSTRVAADTQAPVASTSYHSSTSATSPSQPRSSLSARERLSLGRSSKRRASLDTDGDLLYPTRQLHAPHSSNRASHYSTSDDHSIGEAPSRAHSSTQPPAAVSSPLPHTQSPRDTASSLYTPSQLNQYDRLLGLAGSSASVSPRRSPVPLTNTLQPPPPPLSSSSTRSNPASAAPPSTVLPSTVSAAEHKPLDAPSFSVTLLRRKSTQPRSPYPPAAASTGASSSQRDRSTMGSTVFRRPSLRRRSGSQDSTATAPQKAAPLSPPPMPAVEQRASPNNHASPTAAPKTGAAANNALNIVPSSSTGRFARLFGRRKSVSGTNSAGNLQKPELPVEPVPVLKDANFVMNRKSPPLAVISAGWQNAPVEAKFGPVNDASDRPVSPRTVSHAGSPPSAVHTLPPRSTTRAATASSDQQAARDVPARSKSIDGQTAKAASSFTFPARNSISNDSAKPTRSKNTKHATSRSLPLANIPVSTSISQSAPSSDITDSTGVAVQTPQRRRSRLGRSLSHRKNSKSLSMLGSIFGIDSQAPATSVSPATPQLTASVSERHAPMEKRASQGPDATSSNHFRRPSLRSRLKIGRNMGDQGPQRPTTPEIESWKQRATDVVGSAPTKTERRSRASVDIPSRLKLAEAPVKITRSKSMVRRKPPPEVRQEEIDSSSSTPVYGKTFRALEVDRDAGSPLAGSLASSPATQPTVLAGAISDAENGSKLATHSPAPETSSGAPATRSIQVEPTQIESSQLNVLGLIGASAAPSEGADVSVPSIDIRPSTPSREISPVIAADGAAPIQQKSGLPSSPSMGGKRLSSGMHSVADTSLSVDRPWSLISTSEADTPLLKLRKLVVNTTGDESREEHGANDSLFFRPVARASEILDVAAEDEPAIVAPTEHAVETRKEAKEAMGSDAEQLRSSSQMTTRSDTKHEIGSVHSSGSSTLRAARSVAAQTSVSGLSAASGALSDASQSSTVRIRNVPASLSQQALDSAPVATMTNGAADRDADSVGPLPSRSPAASQLSFRSHQHRRNSSTVSAHSQTTIQQGRRASAASRITARSSGHWSEGRLSEDALSALEAEVGQARRAEVVALGKGRVKDWVGGGGADRPLPTAEAPMLSRSNTFRHQTQSHISSIKAAESGDARLDEREAQRQRKLNEYLSRKLQQLSDAQDGSDATAVPTVVDVEIRDIPDEESQDEGSRPSMPQTSTAILAPRFARLSAFHDRKLGVDLDKPASHTVVPASTSTSQLVEEAIRLGRAPSKRVRRNVSEAKSVGEAVLVTPQPANTLPRRSSLAATRPRRRSGSLSSRKVPNSADIINPTFVPALPTTSLLKAQDVTASSGTQRDPQLKVAAPSKSIGGEGTEADSKLYSKQRTFATSEEAAQAKQLELVEREKRHAEREARRQAQLQQKYAKKKQSDPLLAARLALAGLQPPEAVPKLKPEQLVSDVAELMPVAKSLVVDAGLRVPIVPERRTSSTFPSLLSVPVPPVGRKDSIAGSVTSFHTAQDVPINEPVTASASQSPKAADTAAMGRQQSEPVADTSSTSKGSGEVRPDTSYSIASSLAVDFEFPVPPQRMKEQLSDDGTLLSRAGLQGSPYQQQWRGRRDYMSTASSQRMRTPSRNSSLRHRTNSNLQRNTRVSTLFEPDAALPASATIPQLSPLDSIKHTVALRRSRSVGYNSRDLRKVTRDQLRQDAGLHASPKSLPQEWSSAQARGLGIELDYSNASGSATPSTEVGTQRQAIVA